MYKNIVAFFIGLAMVAISTVAAAEQCKMTILYFNDFRGAIENPDKGLGGATRLANVVGKIDTENLKTGRHTLLFFGGDLVSGTPISEKYKGEVEHKFLDIIGTEAMAIGPHDFDYGVDAFKKRMKASNFPIISANTIDTKNDRLLTTGGTYTFPLGQGCRVGVIGLASAGTPKVTQGDVSSLQFTDPIEAADNYIDDFVEQHEVRVALTHLGPDGNARLAEKVKGFDLIVGGYDQVAPKEHCRKVGGAMICQTPANGEYVGRIDLDVTNGRVTVEKAELIPVKGRQSKDVKEFLKPYLAGMGR